MTPSSFFKLLFDDGEHTCFAYDAKGTKVFSVSSHSPRFQFFSINPLIGNKDLAPDPDKPWHSADRPRRADHNVAKYRTILVEMDRLPLKEQWDLIKKTGLPHSTCVYSGGKSFHFHIVLTEPLTSREEYKNLTLRVFKALGGKNVVDFANQNPSRLSRNPGHFRVDKQKEQKLLYIKERVKLEELEQWLSDQGFPKNDPTEEVSSDFEAYYIARFGEPPSSQQRLFKGIPSPQTRWFLENGAPTGERNITLFKAACDLARCGYTEEEIYDQVAPVCDLPLREIWQVIKNASRKAQAS